MEMENRMMMKKVHLSFYCGLVILLMITGSLHAQKQPKTLTILYTNNINGELLPCPT